MKSLLTLPRSRFHPVMPGDRPGLPVDRAAARPAAAWPIAILGVPLENVTMAAALARVEGFMTARGPHYVVTVNVDFLVQARRDVELRRILREADLALCDGTPLVWASRLLGNPLPERVAGADLVPQLIRSAAANGRRIFLLGAGPGVTALAAARLEAGHPGLQIAGHYSPPFCRLLEMDHQEIVRRVRAARPDLLLVSFGCPKQEKWIAMHYRSLGVPVVMGVGATIDFLAGRVGRAPVWMRRGGCEWFYRLLREPRRLWRRYADNGLCFFPALAAQWWRLRPSWRRIVSRESPAASPPGWLRVSAEGNLDAGTLARNPSFWRKAMQARTHCLLDLSRVRGMDSTGAALLVQWRRQLQREERQLVLLAPGASVQRVLAALQLQDVFLIAGDWAEAQRLAAGCRDGSPPVQLNGAARPLAWQGEITAANVDEAWQLTALYLRAIGGSRPACVIDLSRVPFIDSAGAGLMLRVSQWAARGLRTRILFAGARPDVRNVLRLLGLDRSLLLEGRP